MEKILETDQGNNGYFGSEATDFFYNQHSKKNFDLRVLGSDNNIGIDIHDFFLILAWIFLMMVPFSPLQNMIYKKF